MTDHNLKLGMGRKRVRHIACAIFRKAVFRYIYSTNFDCKIERAETRTKNKKKINVIPYEDQGFTDDKLNFKK